MIEIGRKPRSIVAARLLAVAALAGGLFATVAAAAPLQGMEFGRRWWKNPEVAERLHLTADQIDAIDRVAFDAADRMIELRAEKQRAEMALLRLLGEETLDDQAVERAVKAFEEAQCGLAAVELRARVEIAKILDPEQRAALQRRFERGRQLRDRARPGTRRGR